MVNILFAIDRLAATGGTEQQLAGLIDRLDRASFRPHLAVLAARPGDVVPPRCEILDLGVRRLRSPSTVVTARSLRQYLARERIDVVQTFFQDATAFAIPVAWSARVPARLISYRDLGFWRDRRSELVMRAAARLATGHLANSAAVRDQVRARDGVVPTVIPNGIDTDTIRFREGAPARPAVIFVGNLNRQVKRPDLFVRAAASLAPRHPDVAWLCVGDGQDRPRLERMAADLGVAGRLTFLGRRDDVAHLLPDCAIGVNCSDSEGLANAVLEYMLAGAAVVATDVGGNRELVTPGQTGLLVPPDDAAALAGAIATLLADPALAETLRRNARARVERDFGWERSVRAHEEFYRGQLAGRRRPAAEAR